MKVYSMHCILGAMSFSTTVREKLKIPKYEKTDKTMVIHRPLIGLQTKANHGANSKALLSQDACMIGCSPFAAQG